MRKLSSITLILCGVLFAGCKKDPPFSNADSAFSVTLNGVYYQELSLSGSYSPSTHLITLTTLLWQTNNTNMSFDIPDTLVIGKPYTFNDDLTIDCTYNPGFSFAGGFGAGHGTFTLTSWDKVARNFYGTFNGDLVGPGGDSATLSGGTFRVMGYTLLP